MLLLTCSSLISKTRLYNFDPLNPLLYSKTWVYRGIYYFFISALKHRLWVLVRTASSRRFWRVLTIYVLSRNMKKYQNFLSENFHFLVVKCSVYLNRHVFVMCFSCWLCTVVLFINLVAASKIKSGNVMQPSIYFFLISIYSWGRVVDI